MATKTKVNTTGLDYNSKKSLALMAEPITKKIFISDIEIDHNGQMSVSGIPLASDENIYKQFYKILGLNPKFLNRFGKITGEPTKIALIQAIKAGMALNEVKKQQITLVGNPRTQIITNLMPGHRDHISNRLAIETFERIANMYPQLSMNEFEVDGNGAISMSLITKDTMTPRDRAGQLIKGEEFNPGMMLRNNPLVGLKADGFVHRVICSNGMTTIDNRGSIGMQRLTDVSLEKFMGGIGKLGDNGFVPVVFNENLNRAMHSNASFGEILAAKDIMMNNSALKMDEDLKPFLPEFSSEVHRLASLGVDYAAASNIQLDNCPTKYKVWDVINRITDFGSHDYGFSAKNERIQKKAGDLFNRKNYHADNILSILNLKSN